jgi:serine/threonine protein kinase
MAANFDFQKRIGSGYFGEVWLVTDTGLNVERALKLIPPDKIPDKDNFFSEAQLLKAAEHPNIVKVEETGLMKDGRIYIAMGFLKSGSLDDEASGAYVLLTRAKKIMIDMLRGLEWAHVKGIIHRDIKPANILVGNNHEGKLSDFGLAIDLSTPTKSGKEKYNYLMHLAPEIFAGSTFSISSDIYACGMTLYRLVNGDSYLPSLSNNSLEQAIRKGNFPVRSKYRDFIPRNLRTVINKALSLNPKDRYQSAEEMRHAIEKIEINMNWQEKVLPEAKKWIGSWNYRCYEVEIARARNQGWNVKVTKGASKKSLRRIAKFCHANLDKSRAERIVRRVLQDFVLGRCR